jgi:hypothetical protein
MPATDTKAARTAPQSAWAARVARTLEAPLRALPPIADPLLSRFAGAGEWPVLRRLRAGFGRRHAVVALGLYLAGALVIQSHAVAHLSTQISGNIQGDPTQYMWAMWWWPHAILSGINPFVTHAIWVPDAYNTGSITSTPTLSLLFAPLNAIIGWTRGPVVSYNLASLLAPVLSAWFTYRLCLYLTRAPAASVAGGWLYGFGVYGLSQLQGHLQLVFTYIVPLLLLLALRRLDDDISRRRLIVLATMAIVGAIGIGTEVLFTGTCMLVVTWLAALGCAPAPRRRRVLTVGIELICGYLLAALICSPLLYYALTGPEVEANSNSVLKLGDLLAFVIPTQLVKVGSNRFAPVSALFTELGTVTENGAYLGVLLIAGAVAGMAGSWRRWGTRVLIVATAVAVVWTLGSTLTIVGQSTIWLPWRLLEYRSPFNEITPVRIAAWVSLGMVLAFTLWLARPGRWAPLRWLVALLAAVMLWPNINGEFPSTQRVYDEGVASPAFITQGLYKHYLHPNEVILPIPFGPYGNSLLWQAQARGYFRLASGWFGYFPPDYANTLIGEELLGFHAFDDPVAALRGFIAHTHLGAAIVVPSEAGDWPEVFAHLGMKRTAVGGVWVYDVPAVLRTGES